VLDINGFVNIGFSFYLRRNFIIWFWVWFLFIRFWNIL
jgi:hypothetical protein